MKTENGKLKKYKLGEIATIYNGSTPSTKEADNYDGNIIWATPKDLSDQQSKYFYCGSRNITEKGFNSCSTQLIPANNILMSSRAPIGLFAINKVDCCTNQGFKNIVLDKKIADVEYMYYFLKHHVKEIEALGSGTTFKEVSKTSFEKYEISIPSLLTQQKISAVLSSLDDKIALNRRINAKLEAMAKRLYDYWFVQFDFPFDFAQGKPNADGEFDYAHSPSDSRPNRNDCPPVAERSRGYKSSGGNMEYNATLKREIPAGWEVKRLGEVISKIDSGKRPAGGIDKSLTSGIPSLGAECIDELGVFDFSATPFIDFSYSEKMKTGKIENNDILIYKDGAYVGKTTLFRDNFPYKDAFVNEHVFLIHANKETLEEYLYFVLTQKTYFQIMQNLGKAKAAQPGLNREDLQNILLLIPSDDRVLAFHKKVEPLFAQIFNNAKTMGKLTALRDYLLPLLMNGQVSVDTDNVCGFCNAKLAKQVTSCDING